MPDSREMDLIKSRFSRLYSLDTAGLQAEAARLASIIAGPAVPSAVTIHSSPVAGVPSGALVQDIERTKFTDVSEDRTLRVRSIEQNLDEATRYLQTCVALRRDYAELAKLYVDTRLKSEEFFRLDSIHQQEVAAGLYSLPYDETTDELGAAQAGLNEALAQKQMVQDLYSSPGPTPAYASAMSDASRAAYATKSGTIAGWSAINNGNAGNIQNATVDQATYRSNLENASWLYTQHVVNTSVADKQARVATATRKQGYLRQDIGFRSSRAAVSRQLAYVQLDENTRNGSILNYSQRLESTEALFNAAFVKLCQRVMALNRGAVSIYGVPDTLSVPASPPSLDYLAGWLLEVQDNIARVKRQQRVSIFTVWINRWRIRRNMSSTDALKNRTGLRLDLNIEPDDLQTQSGLLRGVAFEYLGTSKRPLRLTVTPPAGALASPAAASSSALIFGRVLSLAPGLDIRPQFPDLFWNGDPFGNWRISTDEDLSGFGIADLAMHIWLAY
ncbi:hypothetical protein JQ561_03850 [Bradyrhizobium diazoefficiens]|nr:hypothetical protein [Bradyrhizobium diazoefficiens]MBR0925729.1 hypothetical protein [Bradyrhizobium diazoefficiens]